MLTQTIILSATKYTVKPTVYAMQGDTGRVLNCAFSDFTVPEGATARLYIHRPNGTFYTETATVDGQVVTVEADQVLTTSGYVNCDLEIEADNETVQSFPFTVRVLATEAGSPQTTEKGVSVAELDERVTALEEAPQGAAWGEITGYLADQTDLKNALDGKADGSVYGADIDSGNATISASGAVEVSGNSIVTTAPTQEFRSVTDSPAHGYSLKIDATDGLKKGTLDADTGEWSYSDVGGISQADADLRYLQLSGGTMTGTIRIPKGSGYQVTPAGIASENGNLIFLSANDASDVYVGGDLKQTNIMYLRGNHIMRRYNWQNFEILDEKNTSANPTLSGGETTLTSLKLNGTNYAVGGGGSLYMHFIVMTTTDNNNNVFVSVISASNTAYNQETLASYLNTLGANGWLKFYPATGNAKLNNSFLPVSGIFYNSDNLSMGVFDASLSSGFRTITPSLWTIVDTVTAL